MARPKGSTNRPKEILVTSITEPVSEPAVYVKEPTQLPMRKIWELMQRHGARVVDNFNRENCKKALESVGYEPEPATVERIEDWWTFKSRLVGRGPITAEDKAGDFSARIYPDGQCDLIRHCPPNRHNRIPGHRYTDETIKIQNLETFAMSLMMLVNECDVIFDETVNDFNANQRAIDEMQSVSVGNSIHGADTRIEQMRVIAEEFGLTGPHAPSVTELPFKLATAMGLKVEGDWQKIATAVVKAGDVADNSRGPAYQ